VAAVALALTGTPAASLRVTFWPQGQSGPARVSTLHCPSAAPACGRLGAPSGNPFAPTPPGTMCTQIYGGPQEALVTGTFGGRRVWARFSRRNGCEIARWNRIAFLFPK
jgi:hypothetical protein